MPCTTKPTKGPSTKMMAETTDEISQGETSLHEESEPEQEVFINPSNPQVHQPVYPNTYMPYIQVPKRDWMVNNVLYHRFLKWKLKYKNILECEHATLCECQKCKKVIAWWGNFGMDQYVSWGLSKEEMNLDTIWERFKDFCKPQSNEVHAHVWSFNNFSRATKALMNGTMLFKCKLILQSIPLRQWKYYTEIFSGFSYKMKILCLEPLERAMLT